MITQPERPSISDQTPYLRPSVTVVITCFNYGRYLADSVGSALRQDGVSVEVVIVDDRSTDDSLAVARGLAETDARVRVVANSRNLGPAGAFNVGWRAATGTFLVRLDADDLLTTGALHRATALLEGHPEVTFVYGRPIHFRSYPPELKELPAGRWKVWSGADWVHRRCRRVQSCITSPEVTMRRSALEAVEGMRDLAHTHDFDLWLRLASIGDVGYLARTVQALHREHADSLSAREVDHRVDLEQRAQVFESLARAGDGDIGGMAQSALRRVAAEALELACREYDKGAAADEVVAEWVRLAASWCDEYQSLPQWRALKRRRRLGPRLTTRTGLGATRSARRRILSVHAQLRWRLTGQ